MVELQGAQQEKFGRPKLLSMHERKGPEATQWQMLGYEPLAANTFMGGIRIGESQHETLIRIEQESSGALWAGGSTMSKNFPGRDPLREAGTRDIVVMQADPDSFQPIFIDVFGSSLTDALLDLALTNPAIPPPPGQDLQERLWVGGFVTGTDAETSVNAHAGGPTDGYLAAYSTGSAPARLWTQHLGGAQADFVTALTLTDQKAIIGMNSKSPELGATPVGWMDQPSILVQIDYEWDTC